MSDAANDYASGYANLTIRTLCHAAAFSTPDPDEKIKVVRTILNKVDNANYGPSLAAASIMNICAMQAFVDLGAHLWYRKTNGNRSQQQKLMANTVLSMSGMVGRSATGNLIQALKTNSNDRKCCLHCGV